MSLNRLNKYKPLIALALFLLAWLITPVFFKLSLRRAFYEIQAPAWTSYSLIQDIQSYWALKLRSKNELIEAGRDLSRLNAAYEIALQENASLKHEFRRLESYLNMPEPPGFRYEVARVVKRDINTWWHRMTVRKGSIHGITEGAGVIFSKGVAGRVVDVHMYQSVIELITSPQFRIAAHLEGDTRPVIFQGQVQKPFCSPEGKVSQIPLDLAQAKDSDHLLVTSQLGGTFPEGITIGSIDQLQPSLDGLFAYAQVSIDSALQSTQEVSILIPHPSQNP